MHLLDKAMDSLIRETIGEDTVPLVNLIKKKSNVSEFKIAEKLDLGINQVRNILYRLSAHNLIDFIRKKDKKKGWYVYYWTLDLERANELILKNKKKKIENLKNLIRVLEKENFFICINDKVIFSFENAMEHDFKCPECGEVLTHKENKREIDKSKNQIKKLELELNEIELEFERIKKRGEAREARKKKPIKKKIKKKVAKRKTKKKKPVKKKKQVKKKNPKKRTKKPVKKTSKKKVKKKKKSRRKSK